MDLKGGIKMKKFLIRNRGIVAFYMLIMALSLGCTYRLNNLHHNVKADNYVIAEYQLGGK